MLERSPALLARDNTITYDNAPPVERVIWPTQIETETATTAISDAQLPFENESFDAVLSSMSLHWINDLPGLFREVRRVLKPDGAFIAAMAGGETLFELRCSFQLAEQERRGGLSPHVSPFAGNIL